MRAPTGTPERRRNNVRYIDTPDGETIAASRGTRKRFARLRTIARIEEERLERVAANPFATGIYFHSEGHELQGERAQLLAERGFITATFFDEGSVMRKASVLNFQLDPRTGGM